MHTDIKFDRNQWLIEELDEFLKELEVNNNASTFDEALDVLGLLHLGADLTVVDIPKAIKFFKFCRDHTHKFATHYPAWHAKHAERGRAQISLLELMDVEKKLRL